jgi:hypothetical protein
VQRSGDQLKELTNSFEVDGFDSTNANTVAEEILRAGGGVKDFVYRQSPNSEIWFLHTDGSLSTMTYSKKEGVYAWAHQTLGGSALVETLSVSASPDGRVDRITLGTNRSGNRRRERVVDDYVATLTTNPHRIGAMYLDGAKIVGAAATSITGLSHLNGQTVGVVVDGGAYTDAVVSGGSVTLPKTSVAWAAVGYKYTARLRPTWPIIEKATGSSAGNVAKISELKILVKDTCDMTIQQVGGLRRVVEFLTTVSVLGAPPVLRSDYIVEPTNFDPDRSQLYDIISDKPYPLNILTITPKVFLQ